ncbi:MAG: hypothetical protein HY567_03460 [Candidatus Kerfeldbacteria bacterium]|nr:hypothetical protein [Candidatus Kerfeldbacteria bacterium]
MLQTQAELTKLFDAPVVIRTLMDGASGKKVLGALGRGSFELVRATRFDAS